jgi:tetratricopeptide (TPR) repeat protein
MERALRAAAEEYRRDRYREALSLLRPVLESAPQSAAANELYALSLYRLGRWRKAARELRRLYEMTGSPDQLPVLADCERALGRVDRVRDIWDQLRREGVSREVLAEGRLVMAGALADDGQLEEAIRLLEPALKRRRSGDLATLRELYALADLYERAGDLPRARQLFSRVAASGPGLLDAEDRLRAIG